MEQTEQKEQIKSKEEGKLEWLLPFVQGTQFDYANVFGTVAWLWSHSPLHIDWSIRMLATNVIPALQNRSFVLVRENGNPIAYEL